MSRYGKKGLVDKWEPDRTFFIGLFVVIAVVVCLLVVFRPHKIEHLITAERDDIVWVRLMNDYGSEETFPAFTATYYTAKDAQSIDEILSVLEQYRYRRMSLFDGEEGGGGLNFSDIYVYVSTEEKIDSFLLPGKTDNMRGADGDTWYHVMGGEERLYQRLYDLMYSKPDIVEINEMPPA